MTSVGRTRVSPMSTLGNRTRSMPAEIRPTVVCQGNIHHFPPWYVHRDVLRKLRMLIVVSGPSIMMAVVEQGLHSMPEITVRRANLTQPGALNGMQPDAIVLDDCSLAQTLHVHNAPVVICLEQSANYEFALVHGIHQASGRLADLIALIQRSLERGHAAPARESLPTEPTTRRTVPISNRSMPPGLAPSP